ncbi:Flagellar hook-basal body complex protein FliE [Paramixta manurensis]|uniref:Flagellar hook-basal body complex protein FliE n=1 Tax=Paramixta manurensis TaxID=2740817 RepID=A0A6M8U7L1_9GAMM|nr:Flagellar hook-basal body complex protein FliE [Erwiniaceae bacterium PD-1]
MNKIDATGIHTAQRQLIQQMQQVSAQAGAANIAPANRVSDNAVSFGSVLNDALDHVNAQQQTASAKQHAVEMGESDDLTGAMLESQKASVSFSALIQVRNKLTSALDELINVPL